MSQNYILNHYCLVPYIKQDGTIIKFVEKACISTDCFQAAYEVACDELSFAHKISSETIITGEEVIET